MNVSQRAARNFILQALAQPALPKVPIFAIAGNVVSGGLIRQVCANGLRYGTIAVGVDDRMPDGVWRYDAQENIIYCGDSLSDDPWSYALAIHELTHATCDLLRRDMDYGTSESMAYIVQSAYAMLWLPGDRWLRGPEGPEGRRDPDWERMLEIAWNIATKLVTPGDADRPPAPTDQARTAKHLFSIELDDVRALRSALSTIGLYRNVTSVVNNDG